MTQVPKIYKGGRLLTFQRGYNLKFCIRMSSLVKLKPSFLTLFLIISVALGASRMLSPIDASSDQESSGTPIRSTIEYIALIFVNFTPKDETVCQQNEEGDKAAKHTNSVVCMEASGGAHLVCDGGSTEVHTKAGVIGIRANGESTILESRNHIMSISDETGTLSNHTLLELIVGLKQAMVLLIWRPLLDQRNYLKQCPSNPTQGLFPHFTFPT
jgi:hypothetical protein